MGHNIIRSLSVCFLLLFLTFISSFSPVLATVTQDNTAGTWTDNYSDATGISSKSNMDVDVATGLLKLTNAGGTFTAPFNTSGYIIATHIVPDLMAKWGTITLTETVPANTTIKVQILDDGGYAYADSDLPGNTAGFSGTPIDISALNPLISANHYGYPSGKSGKIKLKISFTTTDTSVTPSVDVVSFNWTITQGDVSATTLATTGWPENYVNSRSTLHIPNSISGIYPTYRWVNDFSEFGFGGPIIDGPGNVIYYNSGGYNTGGADVWPAKYRALNRNTGAVVWTRATEGQMNGNMTLGQNNTIYTADQFNDVFFALDGSTGVVKWLRNNIYLAHGSDLMAIATDGTLYTQRGGNSNVNDIYALNPDGSIKWQKLIDVGANDNSSEQIAIGSDGTLYISIFTIGTVYALSPTDGTVKWTYNVGGTTSTPMIGPDGTVYLGSGYGNTFEKKIFALNSDGTLKWSRSIGVVSDYYQRLTLRSDGVLLADRSVPTPGTANYVEAMDSATGTLLWSQAITSNQTTRIAFSDGRDGFVTTGYNSPNGEFLYYYDKSPAFKWRVAFTDPSPVLTGQMEDANGYLYGSYSYVPAGGTDRYHKAYSLGPWTLSVVTTSNTGKENLHAGDKLNFTATTNMAATNPLFGGSNAVQAVIDNGDTVTLANTGSDSSGNTIWTGSYTVPGTLTNGNHSYTIEAAQAYIQTDITTRFASAPTLSGNTGISTSGNFQMEGGVSVTGSSIWDPNCVPLWKYCINGGPHYVGLDHFVVGGDFTGMLGKVFVTKDIYRDDIYAKVTRAKPEQLITGKIPFPWSQGLMAVGEIFSVEAFSAFNGYPIPNFARRTIISVPYDTAKTKSVDVGKLKLAYYQKSTKTWQVLWDNNVVNFDTHELGNTTLDALTLFTAVSAPESSMATTVPGIIPPTTQAPAVPTAPAPAKVTPQQTKPKTCFLLWCW